MSHPEHALKGPKHKSLSRIALAAALGIAGCQPNYNDIPEEELTTTGDGSTGNEVGSSSGAEGSSSTGVDTGTGTSDLGSSSGDCSSSTSEGQDVVCDSEQQVNNPNCGGETPYCSAGSECVSCTQINCQTLEPNKPYCDAESGACVECIKDKDCNEQAPVCDEESKTCVGCSEHDQCPDSACDIEEGSCMDPNKVLYVYGNIEASGTCTETVSKNGGTKENPYCTLDFALTHAKNSDNPSGWTFRLKPWAVWPQAYFHMPEAEAKVTYAILAEENTEIEIESPIPAIKANGNQRVYLGNLNISNYGKADHATVDCTNAAIYMNNCEIEGGTGPGVRSKDCNVVISDSTIHNNESEGIEATGGKLTLRNTHITDNGEHNIYGGGGTNLNGVELDFAYSSILMNHNVEGGVDSVACTGNTTGVVRNSVIGRSLLHGENKSINGCEGVTFSFNLVDGGVGGQNYYYAPGEIVSLFDWDKTTGVFRWKENLDKPEDITSAIWMEGDPRRDFEGDLRTSADDVHTYPGADTPASL